jgi:hypothetical protein
MFALRPLLARCQPLKTVYHWTRARWFQALLVISPVLLARVRYRIAWGRWPDLANPGTFDEKLLWLNLYWRHPLKTECGDKYTLRGYVERLGLGHLLPRLHGVYESVAEIDFGALPYPCVLKCSHGCKCNVFYRTPETLDLAVARRDLARWMRTDYSRLLGELHYAGMTPRILCEEFLDDGTGELPTDYKLYCFGGKVHCVLVCRGRTANDRARVEFYDQDCENVLPYDRSSRPASLPAGPPAAYAEMRQAAETLSQPFPFVRVDFYSIRGRAVLGEMTFTPAACIRPSHTELAERVLGDLTLLPENYP